MPAVRRNLTDLAAILGDPVLGSIPAGQCTVVSDPADARAAYGALQSAARAAEDTLVVYFAGHGLLGARGELFLAMADTDPAELRVSALEYDVLREVLSQCGADNRIVVLDCCFSGRAVPGLGAVLSLTAIQGTYVLASAPPNGVALAPEGAVHTAFTGELIALLQDGVPDGPELLGLGEIYRRVLWAAVRKGLPRPEGSGTGTADLVALVRNSALRPPVPATAADSEVPDTPEPPHAPWVPDSPGGPERVPPTPPEAAKASGTPSDIPLAVSPAMWPGPTPAWPSRRRALASLAAVAVGGGGLGIGIAAWKSLDEERRGAGGPTPADRPSTSPDSMTTTATASPGATVDAESGGGATAGSSPTASHSSASKSAPDGGVPNERGTAAGESDASAGKVIAETADIPVGGGLVLVEQQIVVTQPEPDVFRAFTAVCTHQGCTVTEISDGAIHCPCHGSTFAVEDGTVLGGPATGPLPSARIQVRGARIEIAADT
ncbi:MULTISPECIES: Rieske 2Fe-2S domain-containing protein [unclassified Streptomyces]|uniref:caspase, EACC1-associated type n=1 Tax=unclassified Streptomyces TaxID=2593676 RepID=UPI001F037E37|nr:MULTISPECIES: Rieske 2Fe-2S domain-containing protein [unclassified Streptomyces]MCH0563471.1 Rieske 2Fe-2S domain-containing protein [Streptomyces sp. MUM 2J]MCH0570167.1 Rieske 2Fe-2S domain-containing protein [Streptomyces sp. MUM 136J]